MKSVIKQLTGTELTFPWVIGYTMQEGGTVNCIFLDTEAEADAMVTEFSTNQTVTLNKGTPAEQTLRPESVFKMQTLSQHYKLSY